MTLIQTLNTAKHTFAILIQWTNKGPLMLNSIISWTSSRIYVIMETNEHVYPVGSTTCSWNNFVEFFMRWFLRWFRIFPNHQPRFVFIRIAVRFAQNKFEAIGRCTFPSRIKAHLMSRPAAKFENGTSARTKYQFAIELLPWIISIIMFAFCCVISLDAPAPSASSSIFNLIVLARNVRVRKLFSEHEVH